MGLLTQITKSNDRNNQMTSGHHGIETLFTLPSVRGILKYYLIVSLQWRHNEHHGISNPQHIDCLFNHLFRRTRKKTSKLRVTGLCEAYPLMTGGFPSQRASNMENISIWWRHHVAQKLQKVAHVLKQCWFYHIAPFSILLHIRFAGCFYTENWSDCHNADFVITAWWHCRLS